MSVEQIELIGELMSLYIILGMMKAFAIFFICLGAGLLAVGLINIWFRN